MNDRNVGRFWIPIEHIRNNPDEVSDIFSKLKIVPVRCEMMFDRAAFEYVALCPFFREVPPHLITPSYELIIHRNGNKEAIYTIREMI